MNFDLNVGIPENEHVTRYRDLYRAANLHITTGFIVKVGSVAIAVLILFVSILTSERLVAIGLIYAIAVVGIGFLFGMMGGKSERIGERGLRLAAAVYAQHLGVAEHVRKTGRLPEKIGGPWDVIVMNLVIKERGIDFELKPDEQVIYDAMVREGRLPGGSVVLFD